MVHLGSFPSAMFLLVFVGSSTSDNFKTMKWQAGDVIGCKHFGIIGVFGARHWMLASDENRVINMVKMSSTKGVIREQTRSKAAKRFMVGSCTNFGKSYDKSRGEAVDAARMMVDTPYYYDMSGCNSQHFVNKWTDDAGGYSTSSAWWAMPYCAAY